MVCTETFCASRIGSRGLVKLLPCSISDKMQEYRSLHCPPSVMGKFLQLPSCVALHCKQISNINLCFFLISLNVQWPTFIEIKLIVCVAVGYNFEFRVRDFIHFHSQCSVPVLVSEESSLFVHLICPNLHMDFGSSFKLFDSLTVVWRSLFPDLQDLDWSNTIYSTCVGLNPSFANRVDLLVLLSDNDLTSDMVVLLGWPETEGDRRDDGAANRPGALKAGLGDGL